MKNNICLLVIVTLVALIGVLVYAQYFRPLRIWIDGQSWRVSGPGHLRSIKVSSRLKNSPEADLENSWGVVAVPLWGSDGSISCFTAPHPEISGTEITLSKAQVQIIEGISSSGKSWVYKIELNNH